MVNVGKYTSPMDAMGSIIFLLSIRIFEVISESMVVGQIGLLSQESCMKHIFNL